MSDERQQDEKLWDAEETADFLGISESTVRRRVSDGSIPFRRIGARVVFIPSEIRDWVIAHPVSPPAPEGTAA